MRAAHVHRGVRRSPTATIAIVPMLTLCTPDIGDIPRHSGEHPVDCVNPRRMESICPIAPRTFGAFPCCPLATNAVSITRSTLASPASADMLSSRRRATAGDPDYFFFSRKSPIFRQAKPREVPARGGIDKYVRSIASLHRSTPLDRPRSGSTSRLSGDIPQAEPGWRPAGSP
jgi:hypothetical protein